MEANWKVFVVSDDYKWVLLIVMVQILHYLIVVIGAGKPRSKLFTQEWMQEHFGQIHSEELDGQQIIKGGYPDHGSGRYTMKAGYAAWMEFNKAQRVHYNYLEHISQMICMFLVTGLAYPKTTTVVASLYTAGRILFGVGYSLYGPKGRMAAVPIIMLTQFFFPAFMMFAMWKMTSWGGDNLADAQAKFNEINATSA